MLEIYWLNEEDKLEIRWDGDTREIRSFTRGTKEPLYVGNSLDAAAESLGLTRESLDQAMMGDAEVVGE